MTYINPETKHNQASTSISQILVNVVAAAKQQDWISVCNDLKLLPQTKSRQKPKLFILAAKDWQIAFDVALFALQKADFQHRWEISKLIPLFGEQAIPILIALLEDEATEADLRWFVCKILGKFPDERVVIALVKLLQQASDRDLREIAGKTLREIGDDAVGALSDLIAHSEHRPLAVEALSYIRTTKTIEPLLEVTSTPEPKLRAIAIKALSSFHDPRIPVFLIRALEDKASQVRIEAAIALGYRRDLDAELNLVGHLSALLSDFNLEVCKQSAISLGRMKQDRANTAMLAALTAETTPVSLKVDLVKALGWSEIGSAIDCLEEALPISSGIVTQEIITVLGRVSTSELKPTATRVLLSFWHAREGELTPKLKQSLATSLGELRCSDAREVLEELSQDSDRKVQLHAKSALKKII